MSNPFDKHPNAQKWTAEIVISILLAIELDARVGDSLFLSKALNKQSLYRHIWGYWKRVFYDNDDIIELMLRIESLFEAKLLEGALKKELSPWVAVITLKNSFYWSDNPAREEKRALHRRAD